jgi:two-component system, chemotaxis family, sensor kinase CheA
MTSKDDDLMKRLLAIFKIEAREHIEAIASGLVGLEKAATEEARAGILDQTFRGAHSLKGAARAVNVTDIEALCQSLEGAFAAMKRNEIVASPELFDLLHRIVDALSELLEFTDTGAPASAKSRVADLVHSLQIALTGNLSTQTPGLAKAPREVSVATTLESARGGAEEKRSAIDTVRVSVAKLDAVLFQAEELLFAKQAGRQCAVKLREVQGRPSEWRKKWNKLRPDMRLIQQSLEIKEEGNGRRAVGPQLARLVEFLDWSRGFVETLETELTHLSRAADHDQRTVGTMVDNLLDEMKKVVMQPFSTLLDVFPRFVRELSRDQGREVELSIRGGDIEIDRRILEEMKDPLIHLVRNCLDHGIEMPAERTRKGKPAGGALTIGISARNGSNVELLISDDGGGIDVEKVKAAAGKLQLFSPGRAEGPADKETLSLIFQSGVSTSPIITDVSGRGLGLAIVKEKVEKLNGVLSVESELGRGTSFRIILPLTLARFHGVIVRAGEQLFVFPTSHVERVVRVKQEEIKTIENRETISLNGQAISLARLQQVLGLNVKVIADQQSDILPAVVLASVNQRIAFVVDEVLNEQEVLVKALGKQLTRVRNIAGATVLGSGKVVPILNVPDLIKSAVQISQTAIHAPTDPAETIGIKKKSVLVAEDSITSRTLLKNILETAGYQVETAVDGMDAYTKLRSGKFDLVVSDVDMPRMNGFGLTAKIRADKKFAELPVILVTALDSREDREHGIDVGASAYIVKSDFDQSNLLEIVQRLI